MCEQTEIDYLDGDVVWVKLGSTWWPGEVVGPDKLPPDVLPSFRKPPIAVVKFFQETTYEYVKNINSIYKYNCSRKNEFINKGLYMYRTKHGHMEKFPEDVIRAETAVGGDIEILTRDEFQEVKRESYAGIFGDSGKKTPVSGKRGRGKVRPASESPGVSTPTRKFYKEKSDYKVHILVQPTKEGVSQPADTASTPSTSRAGSEVPEDKTQKVDPQPSTFATPVMTSSGTYACPSCPFTTTRLNVLIMHNKTHSVTYTPYTPSPVRKKPPAKIKSTPKTPKPRKEKTEKAQKKPSQAKKRAADNKAEAEAKKVKTDQEIKSSLLADWDDDEADEESNDESTGLITSGSPEVPAGSESPAVPTPAEHPSSQAPRELSSPVEKKSDDTFEKPECSSDSKYEFCEDEDWPVEADAGRKIPRVKNPSKRKDDTKSLSLDEDDVAKEVAELLNKTAVPELPSVPEPLNVEENFPEPSVVKSPDKKPEATIPGNSSEKNPLVSKPTKAIFKTKTFFRSRHSRSQDAIGKYVAEQLNAERIDMLDSELNGSEVVSSPEARESPPVDHVKVARLAPKIQLKKMKAEAAQLREKEKDLMDKKKSDIITKDEPELDNIVPLPSKSFQDVNYPTQEITINKEVPDKKRYEKDNKDTVNTYKNDDEIDKTKSNKDIVNTYKNDDEIDKTKSNENSAIRDKTEFKLSEKMLLSPVKSCKPTHGLAGLIESIEMLKEEQPRLASNDISDHDLEVTIPNTEKDSSDDVKVLSKTEELKLSSPIKSPKTQTYSRIEKSVSPKVVPVEQKTCTPTRDSIESSPQKSSKEIEKDALKTHAPSLQKSYEQVIDPYMNESTASAVDALLSVSREAERVPKITSSGPPEDLFEDDNKDSINNDECVNIVAKDSGMHEDRQDHEMVHDQIEVATQDLNGITEEPLQTDMNQDVEIESTVQEVEENVAIPNKEETIETAAENIPSESDLQIAETLLNLPSTAIQSKTSEHQENVSVPMCIDNQEYDNLVTENVSTVETDIKTYETDENITSTGATTELLIPNNIRYETEQEKSENLNAAQSLVQMSESIDHKINIMESKALNNKNNTKNISNVKQNNGIDTATTVEKKKEHLESENNTEPSTVKSPKFETSSKLLKILEEPTLPKTSIIKTTPIKSAVPTKQVVVTGKEKILNFDVAKSALKGKSQIPKQKIIIRRTGPGKSFINNLSDVVASPDKIILSRSNVSSQDGSAVQTFTIQASPDISSSSDAKQIIIQPKIRKITKPVTKLQKIKPQNSLVQWSETTTKTTNETPVTEEQIFDINSMPVVLSDDILTPESIEKMPIVMSDGNIITNPTNPPKLVKASKPPIVENEKVAISPSPSKTEVKTLLMNPVSDVKVTTTPNILSKSAKLRGAKPMLVIDKATGKQKIIMTKAEPAIKEIKPAPTLLQPVTQTGSKTEKFIILPTGGSPRTTRTQKIVIDPQTGKAHMLVAKGQETQIGAPDNKPVSAKLIPSSSDANTPGNTVMIITNAQGAQSRIVLTPEHEKILFPNKQQPSASQIKTITHRITTNAALAQKTVEKIVTSTAPAKPTRIVPKQKSAIITSKGQLIVGGRVTSTAQNIAPMPEIRPAPKPTIPKRIVASEPKKLVQAIQKTTSEPLIFLQQKSGAVMQLTAAQFEHLQRTGQIVQKAPAPTQEKIVIQKAVTLTTKESYTPTLQKQRVRKSTTASSPTPAKKIKHEIALASAPLPSSAPVPPLTSLSYTVPTATPSVSSIVPSVSNTVSVSTTAPYPDLDNFEELLPSTAIARQATEPQLVAPVPQPVPQPETVVQQPEPVSEALPTQISDGQLQVVAVQGENFGGPPGSFYLCVEDNGTLTPIDNRPLVLENNQLVPMAVETLPVFAPQPERRDILEAALANSDVFHADASRDDAPDFRDLNANVSVHCRVSETSTTLNQPIMTPVEVPSKRDSEPAVPSNLEDGLAVIGVTPHTVPTSLELPITVTDPRIAPKTTDPLSNSNYGTALLTSPNTDMTFVSTEETGIVGPISMPLLTDEESVGKSMPILTDEVTERTVSSVESTIGSPSSIDVRESETEDGGQWTRRLLTPATDISDTSEASAEIPLQPAIQLSVNELSRHS